MRLSKNYIVVLIVVFLFLMPCVIADDTLSLGNPFGTVWEPIKDIFDFNTRSMDDLVPKMRFLFWIVIFTIAFAVFRWLGNSNPSFSWLKGNIAIVLSLALSAISAIFVPNEALMAIGATYGEIGILILFLPVFVGLIAVILATKNRIARIVILFIMLYMLLYFHNLFQSIETVDGMKTFTIKDYKINGQPVTIKGLADLIVVLGMAIIPIWLIIEIFLALSQGFGGGEGGGGGGLGGLFGRRDGEDGGGRDGGREPTEPERMDVQIAQPRNGQVFRRGENVIVEGVVRGGKGPFRVDLAVDNRRPGSFKVFNTGRRRFVTKELNTNEFPVGPEHQISLHTWDSKNQYAEASVVIKFGEEKEFKVQITKPIRPVGGFYPQEYERPSVCGVTVKFIGGTPPFSFRPTIDDSSLDRIHRVVGQWKTTPDREDGQEIGIPPDLPVVMENGHDVHSITVQARDSSGRTDSDNVKISVKRKTKEPGPGDGRKPPAEDYRSLPKDYKKFEGSYNMRQVHELVWNLAHGVNGDVLEKFAKAMIRLKEISEEFKKPEYRKFKDPAIQQFINSVTYAETMFKSADELNKTVIIKKLQEVCTRVGLGEVKGNDSAAFLNKYKAVAPYGKNILHGHIELTLGNIKKTLTAILKIFGSYENIRKYLKTK
jgi:hypothetical protein